jgi:hypothetical protein
VDRRVGRAGRRRDRAARLAGPVASDHFIDRQTHIFERMLEERTGLGEWGGILASYAGLGPFL